MRTGNSSIFKYDLRVPISKISVNIWRNKEAGSDFCVFFMMTAVQVTFIVAT